MSTTTSDELRQKMRAYRKLLEAANAVVLGWYSNDIVPTTMGKERLIQLREAVEECE